MSRAIWKALTASVLGLVIGAQVYAQGNPPGSVCVHYDPVDGNMWVTGNQITLTSFQMESASGSFITENVDAGFAAGPFDVVSANKLFTLRTGGVTDLPIGPVLPPGWTIPQLEEDLAIDGSLSPSGLLSSAPGGGPYLGYPLCVPEPTACGLLLTSLPVVLGRRRRAC